jgi:hypothetical protein
MSAAAEEHGAGGHGNQNEKLNQAAQTGDRRTVLSFGYKDHARDFEKPVTFFKGPETSGEALAQFAGVETSLHGQNDQMCITTRIEAGEHSGKLLVIGVKFLGDGSQVPAPHDSSQGEIEEFGKLRKGSSSLGASPEPKKQRTESPSAE